MTGVIWKIEGIREKESLSESHFYQFMITYKLSVCLKKKPKRKYVSKLENYTIWNTYKSETEANLNEIILDIVSKAVYTTVTSDSLMYRVIWEYKSIHELNGKIFK